MQDKTRKPTTAEASAECKFTCKHCDNNYATKRGLRIHGGKCKWKNVYEAEKILAHRSENGGNGNGDKAIGYGKTSFLIRWKGYNCDHDQWRPHEDVHPELIKQYLQDNDPCDQ